MKLSFRCPACNSIEALGDGIWLRDAETQASAVLCGPCAADVVEARLKPTTSRLVPEPRPPEGPPPFRKSRAKPKKAPKTPPVVGEAMEDWKRRIKGRNVKTAPADPRGPSANTRKASSDAQSR